MLSGKILHIEFDPSGRSLIQIKNRSAPNTEPCGTPALIICHEDILPFRTTMPTISQIIFNLF